MEIKGYYLALIIPLSDFLYEFQDIIPVIRRFEMYFPHDQVPERNSFYSDK